MSSMVCTIFFSNIILNTWVKLLVFELSGYILQSFINTRGVESLISWQDWVVISFMHARNSKMILQCMYSLCELLTSPCISAPPVVDDFSSKKITAGSLVTVAVTMTRVGLFKHHRVDIDRLSSSDHTSLLPLNGTESVSWLSHL